MDLTSAGIAAVDFSPFFISMKASVLATFFVFFAGVAAARWSLRLPRRISGVIDGVFTLPMVLPPTVVGFGLLLLLGAQSPVGQFLTSIGHRIVFSFSATVLAAGVVAFPMMYRTARGAFEQVDNNLISAARTLGHGEWTIFWKVYMPLAWPGVAAGTILAFARALGEFGATLMLAGNIPGRTQTMPIAVFAQVEAGHTEQALLWVIIIVIIAFAAVFLMNFLTMRKSHFRKGDDGV